MQFKRVTATLVSTAILVLGGLVALPGAAVASPAKALWVNATAPVSAHHNSCTTPGFTTIRSALAVALPGATIHVCTGTYVEQLQITSPVSLVAAGAGVTVELPAVPADSTTPCDTASGTGPHPQDEISICTSGTVSIRDITVQALWAAGTCNDDLYGILVAGGADLTMTNSTMIGAGADPINGCQGGVGIQVGRARTHQVGHATLRNVTVSKYQKNGITVDGAGSTSTIAGTTVTGAGETAQIAQNGIQISRGAQGQVTNSSVSGNECDVASCGSNSITDYQSAGILFYGAAAGSGVTRSSINSSDIGVYAFDANAVAPTTPNVTVSNDTLTGDRFEAVLADQGFTSVTNDTITGGNVGIQLAQYAGEAYGARVTAKNDKIMAMAVAAVQVYSDGGTSDVVGSLLVSHSQISGNPGSLTGSVLDNSPAGARYTVTLKNDT